VAGGSVQDLNSNFYLNSVMRILVTGGAGFIGSHLVDALIKRKHRVVVVDDLSVGLRRNVNPKARFIKLAVQDKKLKTVFSSNKFDFVFHLAAQKNVRISVDNPVFDAEVNIVGSLNLLEQCRKFKIKKFIFMSTGGAIYGDTASIPTRETHSEDPISPYGVAKLAIDKYLHYYHTVFGLQYVSLRLANIYGPRQDPKGEAGVVAIFFDRILKNLQPVINGNGKQTRDYVYVGDVVKAGILALQPPVKGIYNIGTAKETSVNSLFAHIRKISNSKFDQKHAPALACEQQRSCLSAGKFRKQVGWRPMFDLPQGLALTYNWFKERYEKKAT